MSFLILILATTSLYAQTKTITGTVKDDKGNGLPGASVIEKTSKAGTKTDVNGKFSLSVPATAKTITISFIGMDTKEISIAKSNTIDIALHPLASSLGDVVVIGYGAERRSRIATAISSVSEKDIKNIPVAGADQMLQGKVAGVTVTTNSGQPGGGVSVRVRGITTISNVTGVSNEPLYVIDGVPIYTSTSSPNQNQLGGVTGGRS